MNLLLRRQIAESILGAIDDRGYCRCPGLDLHTHKSGPVRADRPGRDCRVYLEPSAQNPRGVPSIKCVHTSCSEVVAETARRLRSEIGKAEFDKQSAPPPARPRRRTREEIEQAKEQRRLETLRARSRNALPDIIRDYPWTQAEMFEASPISFDDPLSEARAVVSLFPPTDIVWCGAFADSIAPEDISSAHPQRIARVRACFRSAADWLQDSRQPGPRICPNSMTPGSLSRSDATVQRRLFLVIEHDTLGIEEQGAILRWLNEAVRLRLRCVIHTGGKSLHGWFECPAPAALKELETVLSGMGFDPASFRPHQPYRLPGWQHDKTGRLSSIWFYDNSSTDTHANSQSRPS